MYAIVKSVVMEDIILFTGPLVASRRGGSGLHNNRGALHNMHNPCQPCPLSLINVQTSEQHQPRDLFL